MFFRLDSLIYFFDLFFILCLHRCLLPSAASYFVPHLQRRLPVILTHAQITQTNQEKHQRALKSSNIPTHAHRRCSSDSIELCNVMTLCTQEGFHFCGVMLMCVCVLQERDGMRAILESYDSELAPNEYAPQLNKRLREAEDILLKTQNHNTEMEVCACIYTDITLVFIVSYFIFHIARFIVFKPNLNVNLWCAPPKLLLVCMLLNDTFLIAKDTQKTDKTALVVHKGIVSNTGMKREKTGALVKFWINCPLWFTCSMIPAYHSSYSIHMLFLSILNISKQHTESFLYFLHCVCNFPLLCALIQAQLTKAQEETGALKLQLQTVSIHVHTQYRTYSSSFSFNPNGNTSHPTSELKSKEQGYKKCILLP